jgi:hypothetical protein
LLFIQLNNKKGMFHVYQNKPRTKR